jgi:hypothetical protein
MRFSLALLATSLIAQIDQPTDLTAWLNTKAQALLAERRAKIAAIKTPAEAKARQVWVRAKLLELLKDLPDYKGPLNARTTGTLDQPAYRIEKVIFDSLPRFPVTGNLYVPKTAGKHPAVLFSMGHWNEGKPVAQLLAGNLALQGFVVLVYDPIGQGERQQSYDPIMRVARAGGSVEQHFMAGAAAILAGDNFARYMIHDSMRAIDYLQSRPEVDGEKIGATGCSGGGTQTTFVSALDPRIKAAAPACYMQSFEVLYPGDVGDSEQSWPGFIAAGLDQKDFVELFAPKPWLIASTDGDFFRPAGAKAVYDEAKAYYKLLDAESQVSWVVGPGPHGTPLEVRQAIYGWFSRWLAATTAPVSEVAVKIFPDHELWATKNGQVGLEGARDIVEIIRERWESRAKTNRKPTPITTPTTPPQARVMKDTTEDGLRTRQILLESEPGLWITTRLIEPLQPPAKTILLLEPAPLANTLARQGHRVLAVRVRGIGPAVPDWIRNGGDFLPNTRSWFIDPTRPMVDMRAYDLRRAVDYLAANGAADIRAAASGVPGFWLLRAAQGDPRLKRIWLDRTPATYCQVIGTAVHRDLHDAVSPGACLGADWMELRDSRTLWTDPTDWLRNLKGGLPGFTYRHWEEGDGPLIRKFLE